MNNVTVQITNTPLVIRNGSDVTVQITNTPVTVRSDKQRLLVVNTNPELNLRFPVSVPGPQGPQGVGGSVSTITAAENIAARDLVYLNASGQALKADANSAVKEAIGFAQSAILSGASGAVNFGSGIITGFTGLTAGARYFLSTTPGEITTTKPTGSADVVQQVGFAISSTQLYFEPQPAILLA